MRLGGVNIEHIVRNLFEKANVLSNKIKVESFIGIVKREFLMRDLRKQILVLN
jgi:hypothetical protein